MCHMLADICVVFLQWVKLLLAQAGLQHTEQPTKQSTQLRLLQHSAQVQLAPLLQQPRQLLALRQLLLQVSSHSRPETRQHVPWKASVRIASCFDPCWTQCRDSAVYSGLSRLMT